MAPIALPGVMLQDLSHSEGKGPRYSYPVRLILWIPGIFFASRGSYA